jgi:pimeloyl-ACP methyl ester carboxylesterase
MNRLSRCVLLVGCVLALALPALARDGGPPGSKPMRAGVAFLGADRVVMHDDVVHYRFDVRVGRGEFDTIRIHRVVREARPGRPAKKNMEGVLLLPGSPQLFEEIFMPAAAPSVPPEEGSVALFLASHDVDVWGMDYGWSFIPYGPADFTFLKGWGIDKDASHTRIALSIVRLMRLASGQGVGPIHVLGFSYGGFLAYAVAAEDTQMPGHLRNVKGLVPVDGSLFKAAPGSAGHTNSCNALPGVVANINNGVLYTETNFWQYGAAALSAPDEPSALLPPFTNYQAPLVYLVSIRFLAGWYTTTPLPSVTLRYTNGDRAVNLLANTPVYIPYQSEYDTRASRCGSDLYPVTFDDHLGEVDVPIFMVARADAGLYATTLTASADVTSMVVNPAQSPDLYQHADFFLADGAAAVVWRPILDWILAHR